jgi:hypothetical protein
MNIKKPLLLCALCGRIKLSSSQREKSGEAGI